VVLRAYWKSVFVTMRRGWTVAALTPAPITAREAEAAKTPVAFS
jgi:hypothetical protein